MDSEPVDPVNFHEILKSKDQRILELERRLEEAQIQLATQLTLEENFSNVFRSSPVALVIIRAADRKIIDANNTFLRETGYTLEEVIGHTALELGLPYPPEDLQKLKLPTDQSSIQNQEMRTRDKCGDIRTSLISVEPFEINGEACFLMTGIDITGRVRAEETLNERNTALQEAQIELVNERNRLLAVMDALPAGIAIIDEKGGSIQVNAAYDSIWGADRPSVSTVEDYREYLAWWAETGQLLKPEEWASARAVQKGETVLDQFIKIQKFDGS